MRGIAASEGIGIGSVRVIKKQSEKVEKRTIIHTSQELDRLQSGLESTREQIQKLAEQALASIGIKEAQVFEAHLMILEDPEWLDSIKGLIEKDALNAEYAVSSATKTFEVLFEGIEDPYIRERVADLKDISGRLIRNLLGIQSFDYGQIASDTILVGRDFEPSDTVGFTNPFIKGFVTEIGSATSHTAIIAKTIGIPAVLGLKKITETLQNGDLVAINGSTGEVFLNPDETTLNKLTDLMEAQKRAEEAYRLQLHEESRTLDGKLLEIAGNIGKPSDAKLVADNGGDAIGLFRSEFIFMDRDKAPTEDEQFEAYKLAVTTMKGKPVIIRTLDAGGDKHVPYLNIGEEMNPFLGYRAIRICLKDDALFQTQLRAILRASAFGKVKIMFPMISTLDEVRASKAALEKAKASLRASGIAFDEDMPVGIMVEVPSAAVMADVLAKEVDFMSIGTNDLTQYVLAADRMNESLVDLYSNYDPAVLRLIQNTIKACKEAGIMACMCGEAAGDPLLIPLFLAMGLDEFSMSPSKILRARHIIRQLDCSKLENLRYDVMSETHKSAIKDRLASFQNQLTSTALK